FLLCQLPPASTLFPYTTLFRSRLRRGLELLRPLVALGVETDLEAIAVQGVDALQDVVLALPLDDHGVDGPGTLGGIQLHHADLEDRKSTRLNSSHQIISYAVFC